MKTKYSKKCTGWPSDITVSQELLDLCKHNAPPGSEVKFIGNEIWAEWYSENDPFCQSRTESQGPTEQSEQVLNQNKTKIEPENNNLDQPNYILYGGAIGTVIVMSVFSVILSLRKIK